MCNRSVVGSDRPSAVQATVADDDTEAESAGANYQLEMMRCLREVNVDNNTVGWWVRRRE